MALGSVLFSFLFMFLSFYDRPQLLLRHRRQLNADFCQNPMTHIPIRQGTICSSNRERQSAIMSLEVGQTSSLCPYKICKDFDENRIPKRINRVFCLNQGCTCRKRGVFKCYQLIERIEVRYDKVKGYMDVEHGCVCAVKRSKEVQLWTPVRPVS